MDIEKRHHSFELIARVFARSAELSRDPSTEDGPVGILATALAEIVSDQQELIQVWAVMQLTTVAAQRVALQQRSSQSESPAGGSAQPQTSQDGGEHTGTR
jgi:hypothetical protein